MHPLAAELSAEHTHILRVTLAVDDSVAYWNARRHQMGGAELSGVAMGGVEVNGTNPNRTELSGKARSQAAYEGRWFGAKSEARVNTLLRDMAIRFDAYPRALQAIVCWRPPRTLATWICHIHTQLADPIYRKFTGEFLPSRLNEGYATVDRAVVARWVQSQWPGRWGASTAIKFGANMLAAAYEAGLLSDQKDPRKLAVPRVPGPILSYLLYLLREVEVEGGLTQSPYLRSLTPTQESRTEALRSLPDIQLKALGGVNEFEWAYPDLVTWAQAQSERLSERPSERQGEPHSERQDAGQTESQRTEALA